jgi:superfamily I DNA/RNA helicase
VNVTASDWSLDNAKNTSPVDLPYQWKFVKKGNPGPEMEKERRNCFVAITRTKECLVLSREKSYRGWQQEPLGFLLEIGPVSPN